MKIARYLMIISMILLLAGCWDQRLLRDSRVVYLSGIDVGNNERYLTTSIIREMNISESSRGEISTKSQLETGEGMSVKETSITIDRSIAGNFDPAKGRIIVIGSELAKGNINDLLDSIYRDARININAKMIVADGAAKDLITHLLEEESEKSEFFYQMIRGAEEYTELQNMTIMSVRTYLFDEGRDFTLPYLGIHDETKKVTMIGSALFRNHAFTGAFLTPAETTLLLLFMEERWKKAVITEELDEEDPVAVSVNVKKETIEQLFKKEEKVHAHITLHLDVEVVDYPPEHLDQEARIQLLNEQLSTIFTKNAESLFERLSENQSDVLGLGRELMAYHPEMWDEIKGDDYYEQILVTPKVKVRVTSKGATS